MILSPTAEKAGAVAVLCNQLPAELSGEVTYIQVNDTSLPWLELQPTFLIILLRKLRLWVLPVPMVKLLLPPCCTACFRTMGHKSGLLSTILNKIGDEVFPASHTTPDAINLHSLFARMVAEGCEYCFMEVSSHAIYQKRVEGVYFEGGIFTNLTHDHLDYHKTFKDYLLAKKAFFDSLPRKSFAITNSDDKNGQVMLQNTLARKYSYGLKNMADYKGKVIENLMGGLVMNIDGKEVYCRLVGEFNAANIMAIYACCRLLGLESDAALTALSELSPVEGRFDYFINSNNVTGIVDYAHTPDALENVLKTIHDLRKGTEKIITVVGCGGNRDKEKRPAMASIAVNYSEMVILTSDNPRNEDPAAILEDMKKGVVLTAEKKTLVIENRLEAIRTAAALALPGDIILVAGKGHEKYQEIKGVKYPFDDKQILKEAL
jgi:UDP-N-acetylmuramoyl-L-alanyl-D-glutamate--2,6-diaminopimelate ligase